MPTGTLYVIATPIGNLEDLSFRAVALLKEMDLIVCEDTRRSIKLLNHHGIGRRLESYHEFNEAEKAGRLARRLQSGLRVALISDAGTPTISDPGYRLVRVCRQLGIPVLPVPGPSAAMAALSVSGLPTDEFVFVGFLPARVKARRKKLESLKGIAPTIVFYESARRIRSSLDDMLEVFGNREVLVAREMTKLHETHLFGRIADVLPDVTERGEFVIVVGGAEEAIKEATDLSELSRGDLLKLAAERLGIGKRQLYELLYRKPSSDDG